MKDERLSIIPQLQKLLESSLAQDLCDDYSRQETVDALRLQLAELRQRIINDEACPLPDFTQASFYDDTRRMIERNRELSLKQVINATGIILHTNLGRAPMAEAAVDAIRETALTYSNLEFDLESGKRGSRYMHVEKLLCEISGAEAAVVVNNCAAAVLISLNSIAKDCEVIVSRGELIEIGGGFRMPDVIAATGATMKEVGTTNKTRVSDYAGAINDDTRVLLSNHCSNYQVVGFTESAPIKELVDLAHNNDLTMMYDLGSGAFVDLDQYGIHNEKSVQEIIKTGVDVVTFSGDKFLGGPQAGIILGKQHIIDTIKKNPFLRAMRIDKLSLAALEVTLRFYSRSDEASKHIPILRMMSESQSSLRERCEGLALVINQQSGLNARVEDGTSFIGGGSAPMNEIPTSLLMITAENIPAEALVEKFRQYRPAIVGRVHDGAFVIDLRTVFENQMEALQAAIRAIN